MTIELFYIAGCPNYQPALDGIREALNQEKVSADISQVEVKDQTMADSSRFPGSPTIRVNGVDVEPSARNAASAGMSCRTYAEHGVRRGTPTVDLIRRALRESGITSR